MPTKIQWTEETWNPIVGCSKVSSGCKHCYAIREAHRMAGNPNNKISSVYSGLTRSNGGLNWTGVVRFIEDRLSEPLRWKKPRRVFVNSMSDLFHEDIPLEIVSKIFAVMAAASEHTFQILTKRVGRMADILNDGKFIDLIWKEASAFTHVYDSEWPLRNVWLGVSCEDQKTYDERKEYLRQVPAAIRWFSMEPLLGEIVADWLGDWVVGGGESGHDARPMRLAWARSLRDQCVNAGVPFFFKQWGRYVPRTYQEANNDFRNGSVWIGKNGEIEYATFLLGDLCTWDYEKNGFTLMGDVGNKAAGRLLDGLEWNEYPRKD